MPTLSQIALRKVDGTVSKNSTWGSMLYEEGVLATTDFDRVMWLPRRPENAPTHADALTAALRTPQGTMALRPIQAMALAEAYTKRGAFLPVAVGRGKALISLLAPTLLECERPLLLVPAQLRDQTNLVVLPEMRKHWQIRPDLTVAAYSTLSLVKHADLLNDLKPDLIVLDECHYLKNLSSSRTRRVRRYMAENPETQVVAMSGTVTNRSLRDYWHIALWALKAGIPMPLKWREVCDWADALDEKVERRLAPGALKRFGVPVREGYRSRFVQTPGIVASGADELGTSLQISVAPIKTPSAILKAVYSVYDTWDTPDGDILTEAIQVWAVARQLHMGFYYRIDPPPPIEWAKARKEWSGYVRDTLRHNRRRLDSELQVWNECAGANGPKEWRAWNEIKDSFKPVSVPVWLDDFAVEYCKRWSAKNPHGIIWAEYTAFGKRLGLPYYGAGDSKKLLEASGPVVLSIAAHGTGKNLQAWNANLIPSAPPNGQAWEQLIGRTHRPGQEADEVTVEIFPPFDSIKQAHADALYVHQTTGASRKLLCADYCVLVRKQLEAEANI